MAVGDIISTGAPSMPEALPGLMGPTVAMREALAAYLLGITFRVAGGDDMRDSVFKLEEALDHFPRPSETLNYPCTSIEEMAETSNDQPISPAPLEDTLGTFDSMIGWTGADPQTCLWVVGEAETMFQLDFWCDRDPDRQAIEGQLANIFSPEEGCSGVVLEAPELYFGQDCEFSLLSQRFDDSGLFSERNELRLRCVIEASCAIVALRKVILMKPTTTVDAVDPRDPS